MDKLQISKRNFIFMTIEGSFLFFGLTFLDGNTVVPLFIVTFTGSLQLAGLATTLKMLFIISSQVLIGPYVSRIKNIPGFMKLVMLIFRPLIFVMVPILLIGTNSSVTVWIFMVIFSLIFISEGILGVPWWDFFSRTIPSERRGRLLGYQQFFSGVAGISGGFLIKITLESNVLTDSVKYAIIFGIAGFLLLLSAISMIPLKDFPRAVNTEKIKLLQYYKCLPGYFFANAEFKKLCMVQVASAFANMAIPFILLFSKDTFNLGTRLVSNLIFIQIIGTLIGGLLWGTISHRLGNKYVIILTHAVLILAYSISLISLVFNIAEAVYILVLLGGISIATWIGTMNYLIDIVEEHLRPIFLVLNSIVNFPFTFLFYIAGLIAGAWGFKNLFIIALTAGLVALFLSFRLKSPRQLAL